MIMEWKKTNYTVIDNRCLFCVTISTGEYGPIQALNMCIWNIFIIIALRPLQRNYNSSQRYIHHRHTYIIKTYLHKKLSKI